MNKASHHKQQRKTRQHKQKRAARREEVRKSLAQKTQAAQADEAVHSSLKPMNTVTSIRQTRVRDLVCTIKNDDLSGLLSWHAAEAADAPFDQISIRTEDENGVLADYLLCELCLRERAWRCLGQSLSIGMAHRNANVGPTLQLLLGELIDASDTERADIRQASLTALIPHSQEQYQRLIDEVMESIRHPTVLEVFKAAAGQYYSTDERDQLDAVTSYVNHQATTTVPARRL